MYLFLDRWLSNHLQLECHITWNSCIFGLLVELGNSGEIWCYLICYLLCIVASHLNLLQGTSFHWEEMYSYNIFLLCIWFHWVIYSIGQVRRFRMKRKCFMKMGRFLPLRAGACLT